ncbi:nucleotidyltransferase substrate binding protein [Roseiflexus castenholzii]|jgi:nucleotidyltransferase substrate binding protein (TIGR01987 family)|uniref:Nucleotidyltransferase substrate binding protein, HI0074 family n=1 Tax=Roseiflexus castenholzii (strain DSM 13941 / HLO8) TaxID=383372 RepID=A7NFK5_ROSCS|nr:nucleotidyltransferase substrate binding protein [Roseiflexus castenholzii]ABU56231.1 nucleotidyltransferase substrate binding protein, HI0074 family [Roseiflexus castenholzii DSM 13941]
MTEPDVRWIQRFNHFTRALRQLEKFIAKGELNELEERGLIQAFEYTFELSWNVIKDYFELQGDTGILGSRDAFRLAFRRGLIEHGDVWMSMIKSRALTSHTYNEEIAQQVASAIVNQYYPEFVRLHETLTKLKGNGA